MVRMVALKTLRYGATRNPGDEFEATKPHARMLAAIRKARILAEDEASAKKPRHGIFKRHEKDEPEKTAKDEPEAIKKGERSSEGGDPVAEQPKPKPSEGEVVHDKPKPKPSEGEAVHDKPKPQPMKAKDDKPEPKQTYQTRRLKADDD